MSEWATWMLRLSSMVQSPASKRSEKLPVNLSGLSKLPLNFA